MKLNFKTGAVTCRCTKCGGTFTMGPTAFVQAPLAVKTTCPKCRGVMPKAHKKGGKR